VSCFAADWHRRRGASTSEAAAAMYELIEVIPKKIWGQVSILEPAYMVDDIGEQCCHD
jgi:hypothetical protein